MNRRLIAGWTGVTVTIAVAGGGLFLHGAQAQNSTKSPVAQEPRLRVSAIPVQAITTAETVRVTGQVEADRVASVAAEVADRLLTRPVDRGDWVSKGQILATLNAEVAFASLHQAQAAALRAVAARKQMEAEYDRAAVETKAAISLARAQLQTAKAGEAKTRTFTRLQEMVQAESGLNAAKAEETLARKDYERYEILVREDTLPRQALDRAKTALDAATARRESAEQAVSLAKEGARPEDIEQSAAQVSVANAGLEAASTRPQRLQALRRQIEALQAQEREALAGVEQASIAVRKYAVKAPFAGRVLETQIEPGEMATPGRSIIRLADVRTIKAVFALPERMRGGVRPGKMVTLTADGLPQRVFTGTIKTIGYEADQNARTFPVEISVTNADEALLPGMVVRWAAGTSASSRKRLAVPVAAVASTGSQSYVFKIENQRLRQQKVVLGGPVGRDAIEIIDGLTGQDRIAATPQRLTDGAAIEVVTDAGQENTR